MLKICDIISIFLITNLFFFVLKVTKLLNKKIKTGVIKNIHLYFVRKDLALLQTILSVYALHEV